MTDILLGADRLDTQAPPRGAGTAPPRTRAAGTEPAPIPSDQLLQGCSTVQIIHNGATYRLQLTRHGKLILTK